MSLDRSETGDTQTHPDDVDRGVVRSELLGAIRDRVATTPHGDGVPEGPLFAHVERACDVPGWIVESEITQAIRDGDCYGVGSNPRRYRLARREQTRIDAKRAIDRVRKKRGGDGP